MRGYEPILEGLADRIRADLPARLVAVTGDYPDSVPLPPPRAVRLYPERDEAEYPVVYVLPGEARPEGVQTGGWLTTVREAVVYLEHREETLARLAHALMRYERALMEACLAQAAPAPAHGIRWTATRPGPLFDTEDTTARWQSWMQLTFELTCYEEDR